MEKVCAVLVTYNRLECLKKVLAALNSQTKEISKIFIFDNNSTDGTSQYLRNHGFKILSSSDEVKNNISSNRMLSFHSGKNLGGSGGFANAIKMASQFNCDYMWIMDDDVLPENNCLELLLEKMHDLNVKVAIPSRNDSNYNDSVVKALDYKNFLKYTPYSRKEFYSKPLTKDYYYVVDMAFEGPLIDMDTVRKVGIPDDGFFLEYDDSDYAQRLQKYSKIVYVTNAVLHRQLAKKNEKSVTSKRDRYTWRTYYMLRNNIIFDRRYGKNWAVRNISPRLLLIHKLVKSILDGYAKDNLPLLFKAYHDGMNNRMGKRVDPNY